MNEILDLSKIRTEIDVVNQIKIRKQKDGWTARAFHVKEERLFVQEIASSKACNSPIEALGQLLDQFSNAGGQ